MKASAVGFLLAAALASPLHAQNDPSEVTDGEIARYKETAQAACRESGMARGDPQTGINAFCNCVLETLSKSMKRTEWQQAYFYSLKKQQPEEQAVYAPHRASLEGCRQPRP